MNLKKLSFNQLPLALLLSLVVSACSSNTGYQSNEPQLYLPSSEPQIQFGFGYRSDKIFPKHPIEEVNQKAKQEWKSALEAAICDSYNEMLHSGTSEFEMTNPPMEDWSDKEWKKYMELIVAHQAKLAVYHNFAEAYHSNFGSYYSCKP